LRCPPARQRCVRNWHDGGHFSVACGTIRRFSRLEMAGAVSGISAMRNFLLGAAAIMLLGAVSAPVEAAPAPLNDGVYRSSDAAFLQPVFFIYGRRHYCW